MEFQGINTKVAEFVDGNPHLLGVLSRLGLDGSFGEKTLSELCLSKGLDPHTVLIICKVYSIPSFSPSLKDLQDCKAEVVVKYLRSSHDFYLNKALDSIETSIEKLVAPCSTAQKQVIRSFYAGYKRELENHFNFEENKVLPYVEDVLLGRSRKDFSIDMFEDNHSNVDEKLSDLKNLILKSLPHECDDTLRTSLLRFLFWLQSDLLSHTYIEDDVLVPMVRLMENPLLSSHHHHSQDLLEEEDNELSNREKEILVSVAKGMINKEIADYHNISINTVITHRRNITRKIGIKTVAGLTAYAILNNLVDINSIE